MKVIRGCFYQVRKNGAASESDLTSLNSFYRRCAFTLPIAFFHCYIGISFVYGVQLISGKRFPKLKNYLPMIVYPSYLIGAMCMVFWKNTQIMKKLDKRYTPIWKEIQHAEAKNILGTKY